MTEAELITAAAAGDERAFAKLVLPYRARVTKLAAKWLRDFDAAEDVWQDVQFRVFKNLSRIDPTRKFSSWIMTIAANSTKNELRNRKRHRNLVSIEDLAADAGGELRLSALEDDHHRPDQMLDNRDLGSRLAEAILNLSPAHRAVFTLREMHGMSYNEIAAAGDCSVGTVKSRLHRARNELAAKVN